MTSDSGALDLRDLITMEVVLQLVKNRNHQGSTVRELAGSYAEVSGADEIPEAVFNHVRSRIASMSNGRNKVPGLVKRNKRWYYYEPGTEEAKATESVKLPETVLTSPVRPAGPVADKISYAPGAGGVSVTYQGDIAIPQHYERNDLWSSVSISVPIVLSSGLLWVGDKSEPNGNWTPVSLRKNARVCICSVEPDYPAYFYHQRFVKVVEKGDNGVHHCTIYKLTGDFNLYVER